MNLMLFLFVSIVFFVSILLGNSTSHVQWCWCCWWWWLRFWGTSHWPIFVGAKIYSHSIVYLAFLLTPIFSVRWVFGRIQMQFIDSWLWVYGFICIASTLYTYMLMWCYVFFCCLMDACTCTIKCNANAWLQYS